VLGGILMRMGKTLYLLRHAKSSWEDPTLADHDRPLASRGHRASKVIADQLRRQRITPTLVLCSSSARTRQTLERISVGLGDEIEVRIEEGLYMASSSDLLDRLHQVDARVDSVMLIGHDPAIRELALLLARSGVHLERLREKFPTAALATLAFQGSWGELTPGAAELVAFVKPRELEASPSD
jgi:phosphohistidine phosphatase